MTVTFGKDEIEAFKEAGNVGAGHAAIALTKLFSRHVDMTVPFVRYGDVKTILDEAGFDKDMLVAYEDLDITEPVKYKLAVFFKPESVLNILSVLTATSRNKLTNEADLTNMQKSLIQEIGSTIILRYIAALNKMMKIDAMPKDAPVIKFDQAEAAFSRLFQNNQDNDVFLIQLNLFTEEQRFECQLFIQPDVASIEDYRKAFHLA